MVGVANTGQLREREAGHRRVENGAGAKWKTPRKVPRIPFYFLWGAGPSTQKLEKSRRRAGCSVLEEEWTFVLSCPAASSLSFCLLM